MNCGRRFSVVADARFTLPSSGSMLARVKAVARQAT
jgi:hypothetical protein